MSRDFLRHDQVMPPWMDGFPTDVIPALSGVPTACDDDLLKPGVAISNLRGGLSHGNACTTTSGLGTLGFFAAVNGTRHRELVLVSNRHVLMAHAAKRGDPVYLVFPGRSMDPIGEIADEGEESNHRFQYPGEDAADYFVDCATARVSSKDANIRGDLTVRGIARVHPLDVLGSRAPLVRKIGGATGLTFGRVVDVAASVDSSGGLRVRNLVIRGESGPFVAPGDSGAVVLNERNEAIGLVWGRDDRDPQIAYASHIHPVLARLGITPAYGPV